MVLSVMLQQKNLKMLYPNPSKKKLKQNQRIEYKSLMQKQKTVSSNLRPLKKPRPGDVVGNQKATDLGLLIQKTIHDGYYRVISNGKIAEWHISNIYLITDRIGE